VLYKPEQNTKLNKNFIDIYCNLWIISHMIKLKRKEYNSND